MAEANHQLRIEHPDRETYSGKCTCGRWTSTYSLDDIPLETNGVLEVIALDELTRQHDEHLRQVGLDPLPSDEQDID